jgi:hypothetical protein
MDLIDAMGTEKSQQAYYLLIAASHEAMARSYDLYAAACAVDPGLDASKTAGYVSSYRERAAGYRQHAQDYTRMAKNEAAPPVRTVIQVGECLGIPVTVDGEVAEEDVFTVPARSS